MLIALITLALLQDEQAALRARLAAAPPAVQSYFERRANCNHWSGEEPYNEERRQQIERAWRDLGCDTIDGEEVFLRRYFADLPSALTLIAEGDEQSGW